MEDLGEMINVWIQHHGSLDLNTPEEEIIKFYNKTKKKENETFRKQNN